jgi:hypothetical protein
LQDILNNTYSFSLKIKKVTILFNAEDFMRASCEFLYPPLISPGRGQLRINNTGMSSVAGGVEPLVSPESLPIRKRTLEPSADRETGRPQKKHKKNHGFQISGHNLRRVQSLMLRRRPPGDVLGI